MLDKCMDSVRHYRAFVVCMAASLACWVAYYAWYLAGFPGHSIHVFCEVDSGGLFKQDANSVSSLLLVYFGLDIA